MKYIRPFLLFLFAVVCLAAANHDYFLLPENFFLHKGDKLNLHLISGDVFAKDEEIKYQPAKTAKFMLYEGSKKTDLTKVASDTSAAVLNYTVVNSGQALLEMTRGFEFSDYSRDRYAGFLADQGLDKMSEKVKSGSQFRIKEKYTRYLKTLISVDNQDGSAYEKVLNEDYEIILKDNPYKKQYGDDIVAQLRFKGKPIQGATISIYIKAMSKNVYTQSLITDAKGEISFTVSREGIYLLRSVHIEPTQDKDADYESWWASYTFPFSSSDELPNTYKEFGFGDKH